LDDAVKPTFAHSALNTIEENGVEVKILRDNMPFGRAGSAEFGTYFIGYSRAPRRIELMLENMFIGRPPGNYDRILDFSHAVTGNLFFVPSATFLDNVTPENEADAAPSPEAPPTASTPVKPAPSIAPQKDGSLGIGSLKGDIDHE
jgi:putative iron-dependent peroxidase